MTGICFTWWFLFGFLLWAITFSHVYVWLSQSFKRFMAHLTALFKKALSVSSWKTLTAQIRADTSPCWKDPLASLAQLLIECRICLLNLLDCYEHNYAHLWHWVLLTQKLCQCHFLPGATPNSYQWHQCKLSNIMQSLKYNIMISLGMKITTPLITWVQFSVSRRKMFE